MQKKEFLLVTVVLKKIYSLFIYSYSQTLKTSIPKEINKAEHVYIKAPYIFASSKQN